MKTLTHVKNDSINWSVQLQQTNTSNVISNVDITGLTITVVIKTKAGSTVMTLTNGSGVSITNALTGEFNILRVDTSLLVVGEYFVDIKYTDAGLVTSSESINLSVKERI